MEAFLIMLGSGLIMGVLCRATGHQSALSGE